MYSNRFINWQLDNELYLKSIYNIIINKLKKNNIQIKNEEKLRNNIIKYIYKINYSQLH